MNIAISPLFIFLFLIYEFVCAHMCALAYTYRPEGQFGVSFLRSLFFLLRQLLTGLVFTLQAWLEAGWPPTSRDPSLSTSPALGFQAWVFYIGVIVVNLGIYFC